MKKVLLALSMMAGIGASAQYLPTDSKVTGEPLTPRQEVMVKQAMEAKAAAMEAQATKKSGGPVSQRMSHADLIIGIYGGLNSSSNPSGILQTYVLPIFQDSTVVDDFGTVDNVGAHGGAQVFDVTQPYFQQLQQEPFGANDGYTIDTLYAAGIYDMVMPSSGATTGDTLILELVYGPETGTTMWRDGIVFPNGVFPGQTAALPLLPVRYTGSASHGYAGGLTWNQKIVIKKALTPADTNTVYHKFVPTTPIAIPAGFKFGFAVTFKAGYSYTAGDVYFAGSGSSSTATLNSFRLLEAAAVDQNDDTPYFAEQISLGSASWASSQVLISKTRYNAYPSSQSFRNEMYFPQASLGLLYDAWISGNSTFSVEENKLANSISLYPNPTSGNVTLEIAQGGTYTIDVLNLVGQVVYSEQVSINGGEKLNRDFSSLTKGVYLINLNGEGFSKTSKLTIK